MTDYMKRAEKIAIKAAHQAVSQMRTFGYLPEESAACDTRQGMFVVELAQSLESSIADALATVERETLERAAQVAEDYDIVYEEPGLRQWRNSWNRTVVVIAAAIRALKKEDFG